MFTRLSLSDDSEAIKMKNHMQETVSLMGFPEGTDMSLLFSFMQETIDNLRKEVLNLIPNFTKINELPKYKLGGDKKLSSSFFSEDINIKDLDYYFTNSISRASKTMSECRQIKQNTKTLLKKNTQNNLYYQNKQIKNANKFKQYLIL